MQNFGVALSVVPDEMEIVDIVESLEVPWSYCGPEEGGSPRSISVEAGEVVVLIDVLRPHQFLSEFSEAEIKSLEEKMAGKLSCLVVIHYGGLSLHSRALADRAALKILSRWGGAVALEL